MNTEDAWQDSEKIYWDTYYKITGASSRSIWGEINRLGASISSVIFDQINNVSGNIAEDLINERAD